MDKDYIKWLEGESLLFNAKCLAKIVSGKSSQWGKGYAKPEGFHAVQAAPVWFSAYPPATITKQNQSILQFFADAELWKLFSKIGVKALHTGPMKKAGGLEGKKYTETVDGWFDRVKLDIDSSFGDEEDYLQMASAAKQCGAILAGDIVPGHTGKGADFLLALRNYEDYPGIYSLIEIRQEDWGLLPEVEGEWDSINLSKGAVRNLYENGYIPGDLERVLFSVPGSDVELTGWDATGEIIGVDGIKRRWVYLHYFKAGQPTMNWLDPSHAAERIIAGDIIKSITVLGNKILRLDANPFLGIEKNSDSVTTWSEGHPLSVNASNNIAWLVRKLGGWSFQELNLTLDAVKAFSEYGADLSYDFISRPALQHAILTKDASFLKFMLDLMRDYQIDPSILIHDMQNHDEITYELVHFLEHADDEFVYAGKSMLGKDLRDKIRSEMESLAIGEHAPYNQLSGNGLCTTFTGLVATRLGVRDLSKITEDQKEQIKRGHLLMAIFNALQPGVFGLSGWDLLGVLPLSLKDLGDLLSDGDYRWLNRGAYDLLNLKNGVADAVLPRAKQLYASIEEQLLDEDSFVSQLIKIMGIREKYKIHLSKQLAVLDSKSKSVIMLLHLLPDDLGFEITAINFGNDEVEEVVDLRLLSADKSASCWKIFDLLRGKEEDNFLSGDSLQVKLSAFSAKALLIKGNCSPVIPAVAGI
ncbi:MAG: maltose alpha-D-glucosyltransferase [Gammaproteobacteria bacterium]|nr:maltose alpha-D-glucosyltransferase [Gammaproteobacteria bacterium]